MKKLFEDPKFEVVKYQILDVITGSGDQDETEFVPAGRSGWNN